MALRRADAMSAREGVDTDVSGQSRIGPLFRVLPITDKFWRDFPREDILRLSRSTQATFWEKGEVRDAAL
jgi:hypothetical protein